MKNGLAFLPLIAVAGLFEVSAGAAERLGPVLESLDGISSISVVASDGTHREAKLDDPLQTGDTLEVGPGASLTVAYEDGAQVIVADGSKVKIGEEAETSGEPKVPSIEVQDGGVRALVETYVAPGAPSVEAKPSTAPAPRSHRFLIRTRSAMMGVRGTDFIVQVKDDQVALNTFSGTVEVASDLGSFGGKGMVSVKEGRALTSDGTQAFVPGDFLKEFNKKHPRLENLYVKAQREAGDGTLKKKFSTLREELKLKKGDSPEMIEFPGKKSDKKGK